MLPALNKSILVLFHLVCAAVSLMILKRLEQRTPANAKIVTRRLAEDAAREAFEGICWNLGMAVVFWLVVDGGLKMAPATVILWPSICLKFMNDLYRRSRSVLSDAGGGQ